MKQDIRIKIVLKYVILLFFAQNIYSQTPINIIQSNKLDQIIINDTIFQKFSGNVIIEHSDLKIICDTILIDEYKILMKGWGNAKIFNDTLNCKTDSLHLRKEKNHILFYNNTTIKTNNMTIYSNAIEYDYDSNKLKYSEGGHIIMDDYKIESTQFIYDLKTGFSDFQNQINLNTSEYNVFTQKMSKKNNIINFYGETYIKHVDFTINCNEGIFKKSDILELFNGLIMNFDNKTIRANKLLRDVKNKKNIFQENVHITLDKETEILGNNLTQIDSISTITDKCEIRIVNNPDSIIITGEIMKINENKDELEVKNNVTIKGEEVEGKCDLMIFKSNYKKIHMYKNPVLWINDVQVTGESIMLYKINNQLDSIYIPKNPFIISPHDSLSCYNQIKGKFLEGKFQNNKIEYIMINGNSKMKYFNNSEVESGKIGMNNIKAANIKLVFEKNNVKKIFCFNQIESNHIEITTGGESENSQELMYLNGFMLINRRDIYKKNHF